MTLEGGGRAGLYVFFAGTLLGFSLIQSTQSPSFVSHLRCHGSCVHTSDVTMLKEGGLAASAGTIPSGFFQCDT